MRIFFSIENVFGIYVETHHLVGSFFEKDFGTFGTGQGRDIEHIGFSAAAVVHGIEEYAHGAGHVADVPPIENNTQGLPMGMSVAKFFMPAGDKEEEHQHGDTRKSGMQGNGFHRIPPFALR